MDKQKTRRKSISKIRKRKRPLLDQQLEDVSDTPKSDDESLMQFQHESILRLNPSVILEEDEVNPSQTPEASPSKTKPTSSKPTPVRINSKDEKMTPTKSNDKNTNDKVRKPSTYLKMESGIMYETKFCIIQLTREETTIGGSSWLSVLDGILDVFGTSFTASDNPIMLNSAPFSPFILEIASGNSKIEASNGKQAINDDDSDLHPEAQVHLKIRNELVKHKKFTGLKGECIVLLTEPTANISTYASADVFQTSADLFHTLKDYVTQANLPSLMQGDKVSTFCLNPEGEKIPRFTLWEKWETILKSICRSIDQAKSFSDFRLLVCGSSGTGKSTFARCISNALVQRYRRLVFIDTDVGQPEMNPPGMVTAQLITETRIGAPVASNRMVPICARFLGETSPREEPDIYAEYVEQVCKDGISFASEMQCPIVINSDGWLSGIGAQLLCHLKQQVNPSHVAILQFENAPMKDVVLDICNDVPKECIYTIMSPRKDRDVTYTSAMTRDLQTAAYFSKELAIGRVYNVRFEHMKFASVDGFMDTKIVHMALNGSIVALALETGSTENNDKRILQGNVCGLGLVRGVDVEEGVVYITTPVPINTLEKCDGLILSGAIQLPQILLRVGVSQLNNSKVDIPYVLDRIISTGAAMKSRPTLNRRG